MWREPRPLVWRYGVAVAATLAALLLRLALGPLVRDTSPFLFFVPAVMLGAWYGGFGPGLLATALGAPLGDYFLLEPTLGFYHDPANTARVVVFILVGAQISWLGGALYAARRRAEEDARAARRSEEMYRTLASNFPNGGVFLFDRDLRWVVADGEGLMEAGVSKEQLEGKTVQETLPPGSRQLVEEMCRATLHGRASHQEASYRGHAYQIQTLPLWSDGHVAKGMAIVLDVTDRVQARRALQQSHDDLEKRIEDRTAELRFRKTLLESLSQAALDGILFVSDQQRVLFFNRRFIDLWQIPEPGPSAPLEAVTQSMREKLAASRDPLPGAGTPYPCPEDPPHTELHLKGDRTFECYSAPVADGDGTSYGRVWFFRDITLRKRLERQVLEVCERDQRRYGQDLHEGLGQHLTGVGLMSKSLEQRLSDKAPEEAAEAREMAALIDDAIAHTRDVAKGLRPVALEAEGLAAALEGMAAAVEKTTGVRCSVRGGTAPAVVENDAVATHLYKIAQEAVHHAIQHANPRKIVIGLEGGHGDSGTDVCLTIEDDGNAPPPSAPADAGVSLNVMHYRARMIAAALEVRPGRSGGTVVTCTVPGPVADRRARDE